jgi:formylglycine-generating enzyme required for sulfatase activity
MGHNPSYFSGERNGKFPLENILWIEAAMFANRMSEIAGYEPALTLIKNARGEIVDAVLNGPKESPTKTKGFEAGRAGFYPSTEAQGEYFTRAGSVSAYPWGDDESGLGQHAVYAVDSTQEVGLRKPNAFGLHDTIGNVREWRYDRYGEYPKGTVTDPTGPATGSGRVLRGGSWYRSDPRRLRSALRGRGGPGYRNDFAGVRLVRSVP